MTFARRLAIAAIAAPLTLALASCGEDDAADALAGDIVAEVPAPEGSAWRDQVTRTETGGWLVGNPEAPIKLVEYGSLTCPACGQFSVDGAEALQGEYIDSGRVNFEFRSVILHGVPDLILTRMLECGAPEAAVPLADQVWANLMAGTPAFDTSNSALLEQANALPPEQRLVALADVAGTLDFFAARGISRDQGAACLADFAAAEATSDRANAAATADNVTGTPTFMINGQRVEENGWRGIEATLQRAGARDE